MAHTKLLPPAMAVRLLWARTGLFSDDERSNSSAVIAEGDLNSIKARAETDDQEKLYVLGVLATLNAAFRNLDIIHKKREMNFQENQSLRSSFLESTKEALDFGNKARDAVKSIPAMVIGGSAGSLTLVKALNLSSLNAWLVGLLCAGIGYLVNILIVRKTRQSKMKMFVMQDYERGVYFDQYFRRVSNSLLSLYSEIDQLHKNTFDASYPMDKSPTEFVDDILKGLRPTYCKHVHRHIREKIITPELWPICETGKKEAVGNCPNWQN